MNCDTVENPNNTWILQNTANRVSTVWAITKSHNADPKAVVDVATTNTTHAFALVQETQRQGIHQM